MHAKTWAVAAALAFASTAAAEQDRPRIYFPRHVKRQFVNSTVTQDQTFPAETSQASQTTARTIEDSLSEGAADPGLPLDLPDLGDILTLSIPSTIQLIPTDTDGSGGLPELIVRPTSSDEGEEEDTEEIPTGTSPSDIVLAPTGIVTDPEETETGTETSGEESLNETTETETDKPKPPSLTNILGPILDPVETLISNVVDPIVDPVETLISEIVDPVETLVTNVVDPIVDPVETLVTNIVDPIVDPVETLISEIVDPVETLVTNIVDPIVDPVETLISEIVDPIQTAIPSLIEPIVDPVETLITEIVNPIPTAVESIIEELPIPIPPINDTLPLEPPLTLLPLPEATDPIIEPPLTLLPIPDPTDIGNGTDPTAPPVTSIPVEPTPPVDLPFPPDANVTSGIEPTTIGNDPVVTPPPADNSTNPDDKPTNPPGNQETYTSVPAVTTVTGKDNWLGTQLAADDATATANTDLPAPTTDEELPAGMPNSIDASDDEVSQPDGTTLIRIVFDRRLHYEFVAENFTASQQIFMYLPKVVGHGESVEEAKVKMMRLSPIETKEKKGWITTAAFAYVPTSIIESLQMDIHLTNSDLYNPPHPIAFGLASAIDPSYGIFPGSDLEVTGGESSGEGDGTPFGGEETGEEQTPGQKGATAGIAVGAVGAAVAYGAAMFLVARRYKRKKQAHRRASSLSNTNTGTTDMRFTESGSPATAMMGGALLSRDFSSSYGGVAGGRQSQGSGQSGAGNSGRTAYISAPVAAENSLGWN